MKKVINGKVYNTETAEQLHSWSFSHSNDFAYCEETLYQTKKGALFLYGEGGPMSKYAHCVGNNTTSGGSELKPLSKEEAIRWLENNDGSEKILEFFPESVEEA